MTMDELKLKQNAYIRSVGGSGALRHHLLDMDWCGAAAVGRIMCGRAHRHIGHGPVGDGGKRGL